MQQFAVLSILACGIFTMALEIPLTVRNRGVQRPIGSGRLILATAKTTARDISEQEGNFMVNVGIGTPPQNFRLLVSHDASVTYVRSKECDTGLCPDHAKFDGSKSSTYKQLTKDLQCCVGRGYAVLATDNIVLGDVTIPQAMFAITVNNSDDTKNRDLVHYDGVLGLGLFTQTESVENVEPILTTALKQDAVGQSMYTVWLQRQNGGDCEESKAFLPVVGTLTLGGLNKDKCDASAINWHPLQAPYGTPYFPYYATKVEQISLGDHVFTLDKKITWTAKFTPENEEVLFAPAIIADDIAKRVGAKVETDSFYRYYPIDCKTQTPDDIKIVMDGTEYVIPGKHLIDRFHYPRTCSLNIMAFDLVDSDKYYNFYVGSPFLREYCQTYDAGNSQIGFSKNTDANEMDTQKVCSGAPTSTGLSAMVVATLFAVVAD